MKDQPGRPVSDEVDRTMEYIYNYIQENSDECQFSLKQLQETIKGDFIPDARTIKKRLQRQYDYEILIFEAKGVDTIICFRNAGHKLLSQGWYEAKNSNPEEEKLRVIREAAAIIVEDIQSRPYDMKTYPPPIISWKTLKKLYPLLSTFFFLKLF